MEPTTRQRTRKGSNMGTMSEVMYNVVVIRNPHKGEKRDIPERESSYCCTEYHIYPKTKKEPLMIEIGHNGVITNTFTVHREFMSVYITNVNGTTIRSIPMNK